MDKNRAIVIGASSGIGKGLAEILAANGYKVGITGRRTELLEQLKSQQPDSFIVKTLNVCDTDSIPAKLDELVSELNGLDLLIISSGTGEINKSLDFGIERQTIQTNIEGFTCVCDWAFNYFENQQSGHLVGITSLAGLRGSRHAPAYNATKAYQSNYLEGLRQKAVSLKKPLYITEIRPGFVDTTMAKGDGLFWVSPVNKAVRQIYKAIQAKRKVACITKRWRIIAFILKCLPSVIYDKF